MDSFDTKQTPSYLYNFPTESEITTNLNDISKNKKELSIFLNRAVSLPQSVKEKLITNLINENIYLDPILNQIINDNILEKILKKHVVVGDRIKIQNLIREERDGKLCVNKYNSVQVDIDENDLQETDQQTSSTFVYFNNKKYYKGDNMRDINGSLLQYINKKPVIFKKMGWIFMGRRELNLEELLQCPFGCTDPIAKGDMKEHYVKNHADTLN